MAEDYTESNGVAELMQSEGAYSGCFSACFALYAFTKELAELENSSFFRNYLRSRKKSDILRDFETVMGKVQNREVEAWDRY